MSPTKYHDSSVTQSVANQFTVSSTSQWSHSNWLSINYTSKHPEYQTQNITLGHNISQNIILGHNITLKWSNSSLSITLKQPNSSSITLKCSNSARISHPNDQTQTSSKSYHWVFTRTRCPLSKKLITHINCAYSDTFDEFLVPHRFSSSISNSNIILAEKISHSPKYHTRWSYWITYTPKHFFCRPPWSHSYNGRVRL